MVLDKFADFDHVHDDTLDSHHVAHEFLSAELELRFDIFLLLGLQCLYSGPELIPLMKHAVYIADGYKVNTIRYNIYLIPDDAQFQ